MILLTHETRILLCVAPSDFRRGIDGFAAQCKNELEQEPRSGCVFVFINRARTMIRALCYDGTGYWLMTKRLSRGRFTGWPTGQRALSATSSRELRIIVGGAWSVAEPAVRATQLATSAHSATIIRPCAYRAQQPRQQHRLPTKRRQRALPIYMKTIWMP
jgi:transposase